MLRRLDLPSRANLPRDLLAGFTVGVAQVGNTMAYTILAGVPPVHGLYSAMIGTPLGALGAGSQRMVIVPTAALCLAAGGMLGGLPPEQRVASLVLLTVMAGILMLLAGLLRAGSLVRFIENAVMVGFMAGVSVQIVLGQLASLTGFSSHFTNGTMKAADEILHIDRINLPTTIVGLATMAFIVVLSRSRLRLFAMGMALVLGTLLVALLGLSSVRVVGDIAPISNSFPAPHLPDLSRTIDLLLPALSLAIIALVQAAGISSSITNADGSHGDASRDFVGQGIANVAAGLFGGVTMGGSVNATVLNVSAGSRSRWSAFFAGLVVVAIVLTAAPLVQEVPLAVVAGVLMIAAVSMIQPRAIREIWQADRLSAALMAVTFVLVLFVPLQYAVLAGAALSVLKHVYLSSRTVRVVETQEPAQRRDRACPRARDRAGNRGRTSLSRRR